MDLKYKENWVVHTLIRVLIYPAQAFRYTTKIYLMQYMLNEQVLVSPDVSFEYLG